MNPNTKSLFLVVALILVLIMSGCASVKPVATVELMYAFPFSSDYWVHQDRPWSCEPPQFRLEAGLQTKKKLEFPYVNLNANG